MFLVQIKDGLYPSVTVVNEGRERSRGDGRELLWKKLRYLGLEFRQASQLSARDQAENNYRFAHEFEGLRLCAALQWDSEYNTHLPDLGMLVAMYVRGREQGLFQEEMTFTKFIQFLDNLEGTSVGSSVERSPGLFMDDDDHVHFMYLRGSRLQSEKLEESSLIERFKVVTLSTLVERARMKAEEERDRRETLFTKILEKSPYGNHELSEQIMEAGLHRLTHYRP